MAYSKSGWFTQTLLYSLLGTTTDFFFDASIRVLKQAG